MSGDDADRQKRDMHLLVKSYRALEAEQQNPEAEAEEEKPAAAKGEGGAGDQMVSYRGKSVRRGRGVAHGSPGSGSGRRAEQVRGVSNKRRRAADKGSSEGGGTDVAKVKKALASLGEMHKEGLITKAEYDAKRKQLLDRM